LEAHAKGKTTAALKELIALSPQTATVLRDGKEITVPAGEVRVGETFIVRSGDNIPVDGVVVSGNGAVDESVLTGESIPSEKLHGSEVFAATTNTSGYLRCIATKVGEDTVMAEVVRMVSDAAASKAPIAKVADRVAKFFVPTVVLIAVITTVIWCFVNNSLGYALERGISVLVISCPCALGIATPVAIMVGSGIGARGGLLFKTAAALEVSGRARTVVLDKTGTVTEGKPGVRSVHPFGICSGELLRIAASIESKSEHPLANSVCEYALDEGAELFDDAVILDRGQVLLHEDVQTLLREHVMLVGSAEELALCRGVRVIHQGMTPEDEPMLVGRKGAGFDPGSAQVREISLQKLFVYLTEGGEA
jgi:Cu2+-exporting ATPase